MKRRKLVTMGVTFLLCVGMVGAGFASWVISRDVEKTANGTIKVETVKDARLELSVSKTPTLENTSYTGNADLYFGAPNSEGLATITTPWLQVVRAQDETEVEDLDICLYYKLNCDENGTNLQTLYDSGMQTITLTFTLDTSEIGTAYETAINSKYIAEPTSKVQSVVFEITKDTSENLQLKQGEDVYQVESGTALEFEVKFSYSWGEHFVLNDTSVNPYYYYNTGKTSDGLISEDGIEGDSTWADDAFEALTILEALNTESTFTVTVTGTVS